jgi:hypothetical protein
MKNATQVRWTFLTGLILLGSTLMATSATAAPAVSNVTTNEWHVSIDATSADAIARVCFGVICEELEPVACASGCTVGLDIPSDDSLVGRLVDLTIQDINGAASDPWPLQVPNAQE